MKSMLLLVLFGSLCAVLFSCHTQKVGRRYNIAGLSGKKSHVKFRTISCPSFGGESDIYTQKNTWSSGSEKTEKKFKNGGILTASELNDLGNWELWKDIDSNQLSSYRSIWNMQFTRRFSVVTMNAQKCPVSNVKIRLVSGKQVWWETVSDNHGLAQLWLTDSKSGSLKIECWVDNQLVKTLDDAVPFEKGLNTIILDKAPALKDEIDIVFAVDATSSMGDEIDFLKDDLMGIISGVKAKFPNDDLQLGSVFYQCEGSGNDYVTIESDLSADIQKTLSFIEAKGATGGGDEVVDKALDKAINSISWRPTSRAKLLFILLDEPPSTGSAIVERMNRVYREAAAKGIRIVPCVTSNGAYQSNRSLEFLMRNGAVATNGTFIFLTDDSGVGDAHTVPFTNDYTVELFSTVLERVIQQYCEKETCGEVFSDEPAQTQAENNKEELVSELMDSIVATGSDSLVAATLLPFTAYSNTDELIKHKPLGQLDTVAFLNHFDEQVIEFTAFPSPTFGELTVGASEPITHCEILDQNGRILLREPYAGQLEGKLNLTQLPSGTYHVRCKVGESILQVSIQKL